MGFDLKEMQRYRVLMDVLEKKLRAKDASKLLGISYLHTLRLKEKLKERGPEGHMISKKRVKKKDT